MSIGHSPLWGLKGPPPAAGGFEYDGGTEICPMDKAELRAAVREDLGKGVNSFVISGVFSPVNSRHEVEAGRIVEDEITKAAGKLCSRLLSPLSPL